MPSFKDARTVYAQSSDIKARSYLEYRRDMKRKAIAELEALPWIRQRLTLDFNCPVTVQKAGGDAFLWFLRTGGVSREPDYLAHISCPHKPQSTLKVEFQYAGKAGLDFYDFKLSKVARKRRGSNQREPHQDVLFVYIDKPSKRYALLTPSWIVKHGQKGPVPAWGNRQAYRVPAEIFHKELRLDPDLPSLIQRIDTKTALLDFQHEQISIWRQSLRHELERTIDEQRLLQWHPDHLETFFKTCFVLDHLDKPPANLALWLGYATTYISTIQSLKEAAMLTYILDFLYGRLPTEEIKSNEQKALTTALIKLRSFTLKHARDNGAFTSSPHESPLNETRFALFAINLIEDMTQDLIFYTHASLEPVQLIFGWIDHEKTYQFITTALGSAK